MRKFILVLTAVGAVLLAAGCRSGAALVPGPHSGQPQPTESAGAAKLTLEARPEGSDYRIILAAPQAADLYQIGGTLLFDPARYSVQRVEAGGGLGTPETSLLFSGEAVAGHEQFAYTKKFAGSGANGDVSLLHFIVTPKGKFNLGDFKLDTAKGQLKVRDSKKHDFSVTITQLAVQP